MDLKTFWIFVVLVECYEQSSIPDNVNALSKNYPNRSRSKKSINTEIYLALPPDTIKAGKQDGPPALIRLNPSAPNRLKGKFPTPIERLIQRIQNYFSVYNPPEYLNDLQRPGINNPDNDDEPVVPESNDTQIILPCNGTSTIVIIPVPLENENISTSPDKSEAYEIPMTPKPDCPNDATVPVNHDTTSFTPNLCPDKVTTKPSYFEPLAIVKPKPITPKQTPCTEAVTTVKPKCPEAAANTPKPKCPETTFPKPKCPEIDTTTPKPKCPEENTPKPKCPEETTPKPKCPIETPLKPNCSEVTTPTPKPNCPEMTTSKSPCPPKYSPASSDFKPISGYGASEVPPPNPISIAKPVVGSTVIYFYKNPTTLPPNPPSYYIPSNLTPYEDHTRKPIPPIARLKQLLFPRLYAAFHPEDD